jgi:thiol-disulfide isomerase/thioredoxin
MYKNLYYKTKNFFLINLIFIFSACSEPDYRLVDGNTGRLDDFLGKWLVVNYWADWCPPCIKEMPELTNFYNSNKDSVLVLAYNFDRLEGEELSNQIERFGVDIPSITNDPGLLFGWESPPSLPATYIITPEGKLLHTLIGPQTQEGLEKYINN